MGKRKAKQLEMQRKEMARNARGMGGGMGGGMGSMRTPSYPSYTPTPQPVTVPDTYDAYNAEKKKPMAIRGKGMQLGKKSKTGNAFEQIRGELGPEAEASAPLVAPTVASPKAAAAPAARARWRHLMSRATCNYESPTCRLRSSNLLLRLVTRAALTSWHTQRSTRHSSEIRRSSRWPSQAKDSPRTRASE